MFRKLIVLSCLLSLAFVSCSGEPPTFTYRCEEVDDSICLRSGWAYVQYRRGGSSSFGAALPSSRTILSCHLTESACLNSRITGISYVCANGTPSSLIDATADGLTRCVSCDLLYRLDGTTSAIGTSCQPIALGAAARIGMSNQFGVGEDSPYDLAAIDTTLYMVGDRNDVLYTINIDPNDGTPDGTVIRVGSTDAGFGVSEDIPTGLAAIGSTLYIVGVNNTALYTLNTFSGRATRVNAAVSQFGVNESFPTGLAAIAGTLYMVGSSGDALYTLDTVSGRATRVNAAVSQFGVNESFPTGLAAIAGTLYMVGSSGDALYTLDTVSGRATRVNAAVSQFGVSESFPTGLAAIAGTLYMVGWEQEGLYALRYQ